MLFLLLHVRLDAKENFFRLVAAALFTALG